jgi:hypothetical protein
MSFIPTSIPAGQDLFGLHGRTCRTVAAEAHIERHNNDAEIIKFHGDFDNPGVMVLTESDYEERPGGFNSRHALSRLFSQSPASLRFNRYSEMERSLAKLTITCNSFVDPKPRKRELILGLQIP